MAISIGINGFGRIGRVALRIAINQPDTFAVCRNIFLAFPILQAFQPIH